MQLKLCYMQILRAIFNFYVIPAALAQFLYLCTKKYLEKAKQTMIGDRQYWPLPVVSNAPYRIYYSRLNSFQYLFCSYSGNNDTSSVISTVLIAITFFEIQPGGRQMDSQVLFLPLGILRAKVVVLLSILVLETVILTKQVNIGTTFHTKIFANITVLFYKIYSPSYLS